jgi:hypothetical protein
VDQDGCKLACGSDQKVEIQRCRVEPDMKKCQGDAKVKALKCKQKCAVDAAPALQTACVDSTIASSTVTARARRPDMASADGMIVNCAVYAAGRRVADIDLEADSDWVGARAISCGSPPRAVRGDPATLQAELGLHELAVEDALSAHQRRSSRSTPAASSSSCGPRRGTRKSTSSTPARPILRRAALRRERPHGGPSAMPTCGARRV